MSERSVYSNLTEAAGIFHSREYLQAAEDDLPIKDIDLMELSILTSKARIEEGLQEAYIPDQLLEDPVEVPKTTLFYAVLTARHRDVGDFVKAFMANFLGIKQAMEIEKHLIADKLLWSAHSKDERLKKHTPAILSGLHCENTYLRNLRWLLTTDYRLVLTRALATKTIKTANT